MPVSDNLVRVARALAPLREQKFVFAGATILPLLIDDPAAPPTRSTVDVDAVVDVVTYSQWDRLRVRLQDCGFTIRTDTPSGGRLCLFYCEGIEVDIMPPRVRELGCPSRMLELGFDFAEPHEIADDLEILTLSAPSSLAAKLEAFFDRRARTFKDIDDIVALLDGRLNLEQEVIDSPAEMKWFIAKAFRQLLRDGHVLDIIADIVREPSREKRLLGIMTSLST